MKLKFFSIALAITLVSVFFAWSESSAIFPSNKSPEAALISIFEELEKGSSQKAANDLEAFIRENPAHALADEALLRLGRFHMQEQQYAKASASYEKLLEHFPSSRFKYDALYELGFCRYKAGALKEARAILTALSDNSEAALQTRVKAGIILREMDAATPETADFSGQRKIAIGALLPLNGNYAAFGESALKGILLAADVFGGNDSEVEVHVRHVGPDEASAAKAINELAADENVAGLVGPLLSANAVEAARYAQAKRIPIITLSQRSGVTDAGDYVFRNFLTSGQQAAAIARYSFNKLGHRKFAMLYPNNSYGIELARSFEEEVKRLGGKIVKQTAYAPDDRDFNDEMKYVFGIMAKEKREGRKRVVEYEQSAQVDALFIPDYFNTVSLIAPFMEYFGIKNVQLLGTNGWNSQKLIQLGGRHVEGALFVDGFFSGAKRPETMEFSKKFTEVFGAEPGLIEAQAYDAARLLIKAIEAGSGRPERRAVRDRLLSTGDFSGSAGSLSFDNRREAKKDLFVLTIRNGKIIEAPEL